MDKTTSWVVAIIVVVLVLLGAWYFTGQGTPSPAPGTQNATSTTDTTSGADTGTGADVSVGGSVSVGSSPTIHLTANGFSPSSVTIKKGQSVTWVNDTSGSMWVASAQHPSHSVYSGTTLSEHCPNGSATAFDQCQSGGTYTFMLDKAGTWRYHNHANPSMFGTVIVTE